MFLKVRLPRESGLGATIKCDCRAKEGISLLMLFDEEAAKWGREGTVEAIGTEEELLCFSAAHYSLPGPVGETKSYHRIGGVMVFVGPIGGPREAAEDH